MEMGMELSIADKVLPRVDIGPKAVLELLHAGFVQQPIKVIVNEILPVA